MAALLSVRFLPSLPSQPPLPLKEELKAFASARLWAIYATSFCIIGTTYAAFSYFVPILSELAGFSSQTITLLLFGYGLSMLLGNHLVSRFCGRNDLTLQALGLLLQALFLLLLAQGSEYPLLAAVAVLGIGFSGVSMNPAMVSRLMQLPQAAGHWLILCILRLSPWVSWEAVLSAAMRSPGEPTSMPHLDCHADCATGITEPGSASLLSASSR